MAWFSRNSEPDIGSLAKTPIEQTASRLIPDVGKVIHRLCHLIYRTTDPNRSYQSFMVAKWVLDQIPSLGLSAADLARLTKLTDQLRQNIQRRESMYEMVDAQYFDQLVKLSRIAPRRILCGGALHGHFESSFGTPSGDVCQTISIYAWEQTGFSNRRL